jgi:UDP-3-O-[3-hydroxymyristoyl] glucosamine N-acyltransferase
MYKIKDIAEIIGAQVASDSGSESLNGIASLREAGVQNLSFYADLKYADDFKTSQAASIIVPADLNLNHETAILLKVENVRAALAALLQHIYHAEKPAPQIHPTAVIDESVIVPTDAYIGPYAVIDRNVKLGNRIQIHAHATVSADSAIDDDTIIHSGVRIYPRTTIGKRCIIHANAVLGCDGFGYAPNQQGEYQKIPQVGIVVLENDVEIGANTVIDRASLGKTHIGAGVKLDNLIQIAHNVHIGSHTAIAAQAGIAGSTTIGSHSRIGGQAGIVGHIHLPAKTSVQAQSGVTKAPLREGTALYGSPAFDYRNFMKSYAFFKNLPAVIHDLKNRE